MIDSDTTPRTSFDVVRLYHHRGEPAFEGLGPSISAAQDPTDGKGGRVAKALTRRRNARASAGRSTRPGAAAGGSPARARIRRSSGRMATMSTAEELKLLMTAAKPHRSHEERRPPTDASSHSTRNLVGPRARRGSARLLRASGVCAPCLLAASEFPIFCLRDCPARVARAIGAGSHFRGVRAPPAPA